MPKGSPSQRLRVRADLSERQMRALEAAAKSSGTTTAALVRGLITRELGLQDSETKLLAALGYTAPERRAVKARAARAGRGVVDFIKRTSLDYVPQETREVATNDWRVRIRCSDEQRTEILERAEMVGLSPNQYLLKVGLGYEPKSVIDHKSVAKLLQTSGGLGRIGGLLKLWLTERPGEGVPPDDMRRVLNDLLELQHEIRLKARSL